MGQSKLSRAVVRQPWGNASMGQKTGATFKEGACELLDLA